MVLCVQCVRTISHVRWPFVWLAACVYLFLWCGRGACVARRCIQKENIEKIDSLLGLHTYMHALTMGNGGHRHPLSALLYHQPRLSEHLLRRFIHLCGRRLSIIERRPAYGRQVQRRRPLDG